MPKRKPNPTPWVVFVTLLLVAGGGGFWWMQQQAGQASQQAAAIDRTPPALPIGPVRLLRLDLTRARYLAPDETKTTPAGVKATVLVIAKIPTGLGDGAAMSVQHKTIDCARGRVFDGNVASYDAYGKLMATRVLAASTMGRPVDSDELEANVVCRDKPDPGKPQRLPSFHAAQRDIQTPPDHYEDLAAAHAQDSDYWAWLCAAGARGRWLKTTPEHCDKAVKLNPTQASVQLDRAFLHLMIGKRPQADVDFRAVIGKEPANPLALFGHSLILALGGDKAGAKRFRDQALDLDPKIADWIETTYRFNISTEYMTR